MVRYLMVCYCTIQYTTVQYDIILYNRIQCFTAQYNSVQYGIAQQDTVQYNTVRYGMVGTIHLLSPMGNWSWIQMRCTYSIVASIVITISEKNMEPLGSLGSH